MPRGFNAYTTVWLYPQEPYSGESFAKVSGEFPAFLKPATSLQCPMNPTTEGVREKVFCYSRFCLPIYYFVDLQCRLTRSPHFFVHYIASVWSLYHSSKLIPLRRSIFNFYISIPLVYFCCVCYARLSSCTMTVLLTSAVRNTNW